jgi:thioredoxin 1
MNKAGKVGIVAALVIVVAVILASKKGNSGSEEQPAPAASETSQDFGLTRLPKLVDLGAGKCIPCKMMAPLLEELKKDYAGRLEVIFIDVWEHPNESEEYGIRLIPTQIFYDASGRELFRHEGFISKEDILAKWKELGVQLQPAAKNGG